MDEANALWIPSQSYFPGRSGHHAKWIIIHGTAGFSSAREVGYFFQTVESSTHYIVGLRGEVVQCVDEQDGAYGNGFVSGISGIAGDGIHHDAWWSRSLNPNYVTISIEHVKPQRDNADHLTALQATASFRLIQHICNRHGIPQRWADAHGGITGHYSIDPVHRSFCPGPYPWDELFAFLANDNATP